MHIYRRVGGTILQLLSAYHSVNKRAEKGTQIDVTGDGQTTKLLTGFVGGFLYVATACSLSLVL